MTDQVVLVNEVDEPIGIMDKVEAHRGDGQRHRAISFFVQLKTSLLMQQRSPKNRWWNAVGKYV